MIRAPTFELRVEEVRALGTEGLGFPLGFRVFGMGCGGGLGH